MEIKPLTSDFSVGPQIASGDIAALAKRGFRSLLSNRPDGEAPDQPEWALLKAEAVEHGMKTAHAPVVASAISDSDVASFRNMLKVLPRPVIAFCRTGTRAVMLWALADEEGLSADERIRIAAAAGYDLEPLRARLEQGTAPTQS